MRNKLIRNLLIILLLFSCNDSNNSEFTPETDVMPNQREASYVQMDRLKESFSRALMKVLQEDIVARTIIRDEALKQMDYDYDVIYDWIKDQSLEDGKTLKSHLLKYMSEATHDSLMDLIPNLTIFVPTLPENSFSPDLWDVNSQSPCIAYVNKEKRTRMIYTNDSCDFFSPDLVPGFPVLVVKPNERLVPDSPKVSGEIYTKAGSQINLKFIDKCFNNIDKIPTRSSTGRPPVYSPDFSDIEQRLYDAYNVFYGNNLGWQRDNLYYGLTPENDKGPFNYDMVECLVGFEFVADALTSIRKVCDAGDPQSLPIGTVIQRRELNRLWTDGDLEFMVKVYYASKSGAGTEKVTYFTIDPTFLFKRDWQPMNQSDPFGAYKLMGFTNQKIDLKLPLFEWNLDNYSSTIKIAIEEVDDGTSYTTTNTHTVEFATNFGFDVSFGNRVKIGFKTGGSKKETQTVTYSQIVTDNNDALGEVLVNFADDVITSNAYTTPIGRPGAPKYKLKDYNSKYYTGWYRIYVAPCKMN